MRIMKAGMHAASIIPETILREALAAMKIIKLKDC